MIYQETSAFNIVLVMFLIQEGSIWMKYLALREFLSFTNFPAELMEAQSNYIKMWSLLMFLLGPVQQKPSSSPRQHSF